VFIEEKSRTRDGTAVAACALFGRGSTRGSDYSVVFNGGKKKRKSNRMGWGKGELGEQDLVDFAWETCLNEPLPMKKASG